MLKLLVFSCLLVLAAGQNLCRNARVLNSGNGELCRRDPCNPDSEEIPNPPCPRHCIRENGQCYLKQRVPRGGAGGTGQNNAEREIAQGASQELSGQGSVSGRLFGGAGGAGGCSCLPSGFTAGPNNLPPNLYPPAGLPTGFNQYPTIPGFTPQTPAGGLPHDLFSTLLGGYGNHRFDFPYNCGLNINPLIPTTYNPLLQPPCDIPYCLRIPCRFSDPTLEVNDRACLAIPGCFFDYELRHVRQFSPNTLQGVPVCHLVVRNTNFQRLAQEYTTRSGHPWNAAYTGCLIEQNLPAIQQPDPGCYAIRYLHYIGVWPKIAGWRGIDERCCYLIGGCWIPSIPGPYNCFYPTEINGIQVRAGVDPLQNFGPISMNQQYGLPICRPFDSSSPQGYLNSYHQCRQAGCVLDSSINSQSLLQQFLQYILSDHVPQQYRLPFFQGVYDGSITPSNYRDRLNALINTPTCPNTFPYPGGLGGFNPGASYFQTHIIPLSLEINRRSGETRGRNYNLGGGQAPGFNCAAFAQAQLLTNPMPGLNAGLIAALCPGFQTGYGCPYVPPPPGYGLTLSGSFEGCCERHHCYIPRSLATRSRSGVAAYTSEWGEWDACSVTCGGGTQSRKKTCITHDYDEEGCDDSESMTQERDCNTQGCPAWGPWGNYGPCSVTCGTGEETRTRTCNNAVSDLPNGGCQGPSSQTRPCSAACPCPTFGDWGDWSQCPCELDSSGNQQQTRTRPCTNNCQCQGQTTDNEIGRRNCNRICGKYSCTVNWCLLSFNAVCYKPPICTCTPSNNRCSTYTPNRFLYQPCASSACATFHTTTAVEE